MKKIIITLSIALIAFCPLLAIKTGKSIFYSDSYMLRARGVEAAYWNPANLIKSKYYDLWLPSVNMGVYAKNNALDLDTYNFIMGKEFLNEEDKELLLDKLDGSLRGSFWANSSVLGYAFSNMSISSSVSIVGQMSLSEQYMDILLHGNTEGEYVFDKQHNDLSALSFMDITYGIGDIKLPLIPKVIPPVRFGASASLLAGLGSVHMEEYKGLISSSIDTGMTLKQDVILRTGAGGAGFKGMIGLASNPMPNLEVGLTVDNIFGSITWSMFTEDQKFHFEAENVYASNLNEDFYSQSTKREEIEAFSMELPPELRFGALWTAKKVSLSTDYAQAFKNSMVTSKVGKLSFGARFLPVYFLPIHFGLSLGNSQNPWLASYGISLKSETGEIGIAFQSYDSFIPGPTSKGVSIGSFIRIWY